jgi:hypothetical protein
MVSLLIPVVNLPQVSKTAVAANVPPVSLTSVMHTNFLGREYLSKICEKI